MSNGDGLHFNRLFLALFTFLALTALDYAYYLPPNYFSHYNVSVTGYSNLIVGVNTNATVTLTVIPRAEYYNYYNGYSVTTVYNATLQESGITSIAVNPGDYTVILKAQNKPINYTFDVVSLPVGKGQFINVNRKYIYNLSLSNYSNVSILLVSLKNIDIKASDYVNYTLDPYAYNNEYNSSFYLNKGPNSFTFTTKQLDKIFVYVNVTPALVDPLYFTNASRPYSIGVASYGLYNISGRLVPYEIRTNQVEGYVNITAISAYNATPPVNVSKYGAGVQLNAMLRLKSATGKVYAYWLQDVMSFNTSKSNYSIEDNLWNATTPESILANSTLSGEGGIATYYDTVKKSNQSYYSQYALITPNSYSQYYTFPLYFTPIIRVEIQNGLPVAMFGYQTNSGAHFYDNVTIHLPSSEAYLLTTPYYKTPANATGYSSQFYDTELVFGGESSGEWTHFNNLYAKLWIYYEDNGTLKAFPSVYTLGLDTEESATNLAVSRTSTNLALVGIGTNNNATDIVLQDATTITIPPTIPSTVPTTYPTTTIPENGSGTSPLVQAISEIVGLAVVIGIFYVAYRILKFILGLLRDKAPVSPPSSKRPKRKKR